MRIALRSFALLASVAMLAAACAGDPRRTGSDYVGVFTGEYVDGMPLYRLPAIEVVGSRRSLTL